MIRNIPLNKPCHRQRADQPVHPASDGDMPEIEPGPEPGQERREGAEDVPPAEQEEVEQAA